MNSSALRILPRTTLRCDSRLISFTGLSIALLSTLVVQTSLAQPADEHAEQHDHEHSPNERLPDESPDTRFDDHAHEPLERIGVPEELGQITQALHDQLNAPHLNEQQRAELRNAHGLWTYEDLSNPAFAARAALEVGLYDHPALSHPEANRIDRAFAALMRGQPQLALDLIDTPYETMSFAQLSLHAQALEMLGHQDASIEVLRRVESKLLNETVSDANELAFAVESLMQLTRLTGPESKGSEGNAKATYEQLAKLLANARDNIDRLNWRVRLVEAKLLLEHNNYTQSRQAAVETLRLHPRNAQAAALIAHMAVDAFDFDSAQQIIDKLDAIAASTMRSSTQSADQHLPPTLHSSIIRARIALRQKNARGAEDAIDPMLATMPDQRELLALNAASAAAGFRNISTQHHLNAFDALSPGSPQALMRVAKVLSEYRQYDQAQEMLMKTIDRSPYWAQPRIDLGLLLVQAGKDHKAKSTLEDALQLDPFNVRAQNSLTLVTELLSYETIETDHFIIRYKPESEDLVLANEMPQILERIHHRVCSDQPGGVDFQPDQKTLIEIMPNHEWFAVRIAGMPSIHTMAASTGPVIAMEAPKDGIKSSIGSYDWARVIQHEYTHTVNLARTKNRVIHWMTEANAVYNEDAPRSSRTWSLLADAFKNDSLFDLDEMNIAFVRPKKPSDRSQAYAQGAWMYEFLIEEFGKDAPLKIFDASAAGRSGTEAFEQTLQLTPTSFLNQFKDWARDQLLDRGLILRDHIPDLTELFDTSKENPAEFPSLETIDSFLEQYPNHPQLTTLKIGVALLNANDRLSPYQEQLLIDSIKIRPTDESPHRRLAKHYLASDDINEQLRAVPYLEYLDVREIYSPAYAKELSLLYVRSNKPQLAIEKALRAVSISPYDADLREHAARIALLTHNKALAHHQLKTLIILEPNQEIHKQRLDALLSQIQE